MDPSEKYPQGERIREQIAESRPRGLAETSESCPLWHLRRLHCRKARWYHGLLRPSQGRGNHFFTEEAL